MTAAKKDTKFKPGQSGNPSGRTPGSGWVGEARKALEKDWHGTNGEDGIKAVLVKKAKEGDMAAIRIVAERVCPPMKAMEPTTPISLPEGSLTDRANSVLAGLADGTLNPSQAAQLLQALGAVAKVQEVDELARRIDALEQKNAKPR
jgi:hypothetical protein